MRNGWKSWGLGLAVAAMVGCGLFLALPSSNAAVVVNPAVTCNGTKDHELTLAGGLPVHIRTEGFLTAGIGEAFVTSDGRRGNVLTVNALASEGNVNGLGAVTFKLDSSRNAGSSQIVANQRNAQFPATQTMRFHFTADIGSKSYRSMDPATVLSTNVGSLPPKAGTVYTLANTVRLEYAGSPGKVAGTLAAGKAFTVGG